MANVSGEAEGQSRSESIDRGHAWYALGLLTFAYALAYVDRQMLNLLVDPIRQSLLLSDTRFSLIQGTAFVTAYLAAVPLFGRLVDITNRRNILIFGVCTWSIFTALCGRAESFEMLFLARFGVGFAEACVFPAGISLIADYFSPKRAPTALSVFTLASTLGGGFSLVASGLVIAFAAHLRGAVTAFNSLETWQMAFIVIGLPGLLFAIALLTMREPKRQRLLADDTAEGKMALREVAGALWTRRHFYGRIYMGIGSVAVVALGMTAWFPSYLIRAHGVDPSHVGLRLGTSAVVLGTIGCLSGPLVARWFERRGHADATLRAAAFGMLAMLCGSLAIPLAPNSTTALCIASFIYFIASFPTGIIAAATATATPSRMRGVVAGLYTFSAQLVGYGLGPTAIALVTDKVFGDPKMVGYSMQIVMSVASVIAILMFFPVLRHYRQLTAAHDAEVPPATPNLTSARKGAA